jgi:hypothetical protein
MFGFDAQLFHLLDICKLVTFQSFLPYLWNRNSACSSHIVIAQYLLLLTCCVTFVYFVNMSSVFIAFQDFERSRAFNFLNEVKKRFQTTYGSRAQTALPYAMNSEFSSVLAAQLVRSFSGYSVLIYIFFFITLNHHEYMGSWSAVYFVDCFIISQHNKTSLLKL